jgi:UDP-N-acetylmuramoyl-L-alanyl-D-glutamate--2,6-diaminopimelate ligase
MLNQLLPDETNVPQLEVQGVSNDSRNVQPGDVYLAGPRLILDGRDYIGDARKMGAVAILCEPPVPSLKLDIPLVEVRNLRAKTGNIASRCYNNPSSKMLVIAITGTNGKTSCSHFIAQVLGSIKLKCGVIGTMGVGIPGALEDSAMTTPDPIELQKNLAALLDLSCNAVTLEASSHGLAQDRLIGTEVDIAIFTNITRDHLDYHSSFDEYFASKKLLFSSFELKTAIINCDDEYGRELCEFVSEAVSIYSFGIENKNADVGCSDIELNERGMSFNLQTPWGSRPISSELMGRFNIYNLLATAAVLGSQGLSIESIAQALQSLKTVKGRMEVIRHASIATVIIDYAHTPDALEKALQAIKEHCTGALWCVMGCGGDRDIGKRPLMGEIASRLADYLVITDDNPRSESSSKIAEDIYAGIVAGSDVQVNTNRQSAIRRALSKAKPEDIVLIAGKGHEEYQEIKGTKLSFSDHAVVLEFVGES